MSQSFTNPGVTKTSALELRVNADPCKGTVKPSHNSTLLSSNCTALEELEEQLGVTTTQTSSTQTAPMSSTLAGMHSNQPEFQTELNFTLSCKGSGGDHTTRRCSCASENKST